MKTHLMNKKSFLFNRGDMPKNLIGVYESGETISEPEHSSTSGYKSLIDDALETYRGNSTDMNKDWEDLLLKYLYKPVRSKGVLQEGDVPGIEERARLLKLWGF